MKQLSLIPLGGMGNVTQNLYVYEYDNEILIVDMGIGFPDETMLGIDVILPDITHLLNRVEEGAKIVGLVLSHGHDDHIAALGYLLPKLPDFPIYASPLTAAFAKNRMKDFGLVKEIQVLRPRQKQVLSDNFSVELVNVTHSVPDTRHVYIQTPVGNVYHGSDFKLDDAPVDGILSDYERMTQIGAEGVLVALVDCLRIERSEIVKSESAVGPILRRVMENVKGKCLVTMMSSHIHRIQQAIDAAEALGRKVVFIGRSVEQNVMAAIELGKLRINRETILDKSDMAGVDDSQLCLIIAGSQGQEGSSLVRAVYGEHKEVTISPNDKVIFSADAIPGNDIPYYQSIDELCRNGIEVVYPDIEPGIHQSGHASAPEQMKLVGLLKPKFAMPVGGADRHRLLFMKAAQSALSYQKDQILMPKKGEILVFDGQNAYVDGLVDLHPQTVDGLGVGDVGKTVLSDRKALSESGMVILVIPKRNKKYHTRQMQVISRGFVFMKEAEEVAEFIKQRTEEIIDSLGRNAKEVDVKKAVERRISRSLYKIIKREPVVMTVIVSL